MKITIWDQRQQKILAEFQSSWVPKLGERITVDPDRPNGHRVQDIEPTYDPEANDWSIKLDVH